MQYLVPVHPDHAHPSLTIGEAVDAWLTDEGVETWRTPDGHTRRGMILVRDEAPEGDSAFRALRRGGFDGEVVALAGNQFVDALFRGQICSFVQDPLDGALYRLPREYWADVELSPWGDEGEFVSEQDGVPERLSGQRILLEADASNAWRKGRRLQLIGALSGVLAPVKGHQARSARIKRGAQGGPKKKPAAIRRELDPLFRKYYHTRQLSEMSQRNLRDFIEKFWSNPDFPCPTAKTIASKLTEWETANAIR